MSKFGSGPAWRKFEVIVAALHKLRDMGADVQWNEVIEGRQIDVTVRFERGGYRYLVLIECKNFADAVPVEKVEAFVTKSRHLEANKAIMVSSNGFQSGAIEVAARSQIELYRLVELPESWPEQVITTPEKRTSVYGVVLFPTGHVGPVVVGEDPSLLNQLRFVPANWGRELTLAEVVQHGTKDLESRLNSTEQAFAINFPRGCTVIGLPGGHALQLAALEYRARIATVRVSHRVRPPKIELSKFLYENVVTGEKSEYFGADLPIGLDNKFQAGRYYKNIFGTTYKCEAVTDEGATMLAFLHDQGAPITVRCVFFLKDSPYYVELTDTAEIARWELEAQKIADADAREPAKGRGAE